MPFSLTADVIPGTATWSAAAFTTSYAGGGTIGIGTNTVAIAVNAFWPASADGGFVALTPVGAGDATATSFGFIWDGSGNLTITANANAAADVTLAIGVLAQ
jgi:hypothetical protein